MWRSNTNRRDMLSLDMTSNGSLGCPSAVFVSLVVRRREAILYQFYTFVTDILQTTTPLLPKRRPGWEPSNLVLVKGTWVDRYEHCPGNSPNSAPFDLAWTPLEVEGAKLQAVLLTRALRRMINKNRRRSCLAGSKGDANVTRPPKGNQRPLPHARSL